MYRLRLQRSIHSPVGLGTVYRITDRYSVRQDTQIGRPARTVAHNTRTSRSLQLAGAARGRRCGPCTARQCGRRETTRQRAEDGRGHAARRLRAQARRPDSGSGSGNGGGSDGSSGRGGNGGGGSVVATADGGEEDGQRWRRPVDGGDGSSAALGATTAIAVAAAAERQRCSNGGSSGGSSGGGTGSGDGGRGGGGKPRQPHNRSPGPAASARLMGRRRVGSAHEPAERRCRPRSGRGRRRRSRRSLALRGAGSFGLSPHLQQPQRQGGAATRRSLSSKSSVEQERSPGHVHARTAMSDGRPRPGSACATQTCEFGAPARRGLKLTASGLGLRSIERG